MAAIYNLFKKNSLKNALVFFITFLPIFIYLLGLHPKYFGINFQFGENLFGDLRVILAGVDVQRAIINNISLLPELYMNIAPNQPIVVLNFLSYFNFITLANVIYIGWFQVILFNFLFYLFINSALRISNLSSAKFFVLLTLILLFYLSPIYTMMIFKGNIESILVSLALLSSLLLTSSLHDKRPNLAYSLYLFLISSISLSKIFPLVFFSSPVFINNIITKSKFLNYIKLAIIFLIFVFTIFFIYRNSYLNIISPEFTPRGSQVSFGLTYLQGYITESHSITINMFYFVAFIIFIFTQILNFFYFKSDFNKLEFNYILGMAFTGFLVFSVSYFFFHNWSYRYIWILLTVPYFIINFNIDNKKLIFYLIVFFVLMPFSNYTALDRYLYANTFEVILFLIGASFAFSFIIFCCLKLIYNLKNN